MALFPSRDEIPTRWRRVALAIVLTMQLVFCAGLIWKTPASIVPLPGTHSVIARTLSLDTDFPRYETPAANLARGGSLSMPLEVTHDRTVYDWVCSRHPDACLPDGTHPTTLYPPGYSIFAAGVYKVFGRSLDAVIVIQILMLLGMFTLFEAMAARMLDRAGYAFVMAVAATYPFLAHYAVLFSTEQLHNACYFAGIAAVTLMNPGVLRGVLFGLLFSFATLVRPYALIVFPIIWLWPSVWRAAKAAWRERIMAAVAFAVPLALWAIRNAYWFGKFIPLTTLGAGVVLMHTTISWDYSGYEKHFVDPYYAGLAAQVGEPDITTYNASQKITALAVERIKEHPLKFATSVVKNAPKVWVSLGTSASGVSRAWPLLVTYLGGLLVLGVVGGFQKRHDQRWHFLLLAIGLYWAFLLYTPGEARRSIGIRLPMLLAAGPAASAAVAWWRRRREATTSPTVATD